uniref:Ovule protein n=1 Tax=Ascaris lumbricoides TaxID=6252 RepID=A0A0M3IH04_ASCLU
MRLSPNCSNFLMVQYLYLRYFVQSEKGAIVRRWWNMTKRADVNGKRCQTHRQWQLWLSSIRQ